MSDNVESTTPNEVAPSERGGIYSLPVVGRPLSEVRDFYDEMAPTPDDPRGVALGKNAIRYGSVAATGVVATGMAAIVCL